MLPLRDREGIGVIPWSPMAGGYLTRPDADVDATTRGASERRLYEHPYREGGGREVNERVRQLAGGRGVKMAQVALSWVLHKDAVEALDIDLSESDIEFLEEPYDPVSGHD